MENLPKTIINILDIFALKFGSTGIYLWSKIILQRYIYGVFALFICVVSVVIGIVVIPKWYRRIINGKFDEFTWILFTIIAIILLIGIFGFGYDAITNLINPTYTAIKDLIPGCK